MIKNFKTILLKAKIIHNNNKSYSSYNPKCSSNIEFLTLRTSNATNITSFDDFRIKGILFSMQYYDTHLFDSKMGYNHPIVPTIV